jgi:hypothetical protein
MADGCQFQALPISPWGTSNSPDGEQYGFWFRIADRNPYPPPRIISRAPIDVIFIIYLMSERSRFSGAVPRDGGCRG